MDGVVINGCNRLFRTNLNAQGVSMLAIMQLKQIIETTKEIQYLRSDGIDEHAFHHLRGRDFIHF